MFVVQVLQYLYCGIVIFDGNCVCDEMVFVDFEFVDVGGGE